jgi:autotransporter-associated beta strand protein
LVADQLSLDGGILGTASSSPVTISATRGITIGSGGGTFATAATSAALTILSPITGSGNLTRTGSSAVTLRASSDFTGTFTILDNRTEVWADNSLGLGTLTFNVTGNGTLVNNNSPAADVTLGNSIVNLSAGSIDISANSGRNLTLTGRLTGPAAWKKDNGGSTGTVTLTNSTSDFSGGLTVVAGQLAITANNTLGSSAGATTINSGASLVMRGGFNYTTAEPVSVGGNGSTASNGAINNAADTNAFAGPITLSANTRINAAAGQLTLGGVINDGASVFALEKTGPGTLALTNANTYDGGTTVAGGTLLASNTTGSATGTGSVNVTGGTLGGTGFITGAVNINAAGTLAPGESIESLDTGNLSFTANSAQFLVEIDIDGNAADVVNVTGAVDLNGPANTAAPQLVFSFVTGTPPLGSPVAFTIVNNDTNSDAVDGIFAGMPDDLPVTQNGTYFSVNYNGGDGNDIVVTFTEVPEPTSVAAIAVAAGLMLRRRRR